MKWRNKKTGAIVDIKSIISSDAWEEVKTSHVSFDEKEDAPVKAEKKTTRGRKK